MPVESDDAIFGMANVRGQYVVTEPYDLDFSFYFSSKEGVSHGIRVKPIFDRARMKRSLAGNLELHGDWKYTPGDNDRKVSHSKMLRMIDFFRKYKVLFAAVWEEQLNEDTLQDFFRGFCTLHDLIQDLDCYGANQDILCIVSDVATLERLVRKYHLFNMND